MEEKILNFLLSLVSSLGPWGYLILFILAFLESAAFLGLIAPGESAVVIAGLLAARGALDLPLVVAVAILGAILGDSTGYLLGSRWGDPFFARFGKYAFIRRQELDAARRFFERHGGKTVLIARFTTWLRALAPFIAGTVHMPYLRFLFFNIYGAVLWVMVYALLGYLVGNSWQAIRAIIGRYGLILGAAAILLTVAYLFGRRKKDLLRQRAGQLDRFLTSRLPGAWGFVKDRFRRGPWHGRSLTIGLLLLGLSLASLSEIFRSLLQQSFITRLADLTRQFIEGILTPPLTRILAAAGRAAGLYVGGAVGAALLAVLLWKRRWWLLLVCFLAGLGVGVAGAMNRMLPLSSREGFPSLEAFTAMLVYGLLAFVAWEMVPGEILRILLYSAAALLAALAGFGRVYLDAQALPEILAGFTAAFAWLVFSILLGRTLRQLWRDSG